MTHPWTPLEAREFRVLLGLNIRATRLALGLTIREACARTSGSMCQATWQSYESAVRAVSVTALFEVAGALRVDAVDLIPPGPRRLQLDVDAPGVATHWLVVHESADDGLDIEHPDCPTRAGRHSAPGFKYVEHVCEVEAWLEYAGLPWRHRDALPDHPDHPGATTPLGPGRYRIAFVADAVDAGLVLRDAS
jgi:transcriptional regulator with XRE-family HTH domain